MAAARASIPTPSWHQVTPTPIVLLSGPEDVLADRARTRIKAALGAAADIEQSALDAADYTGGTLLSAASPSLFAQPRLIEVDHLETMNDAFLADALSYLDVIDPDVTLVLRHRKGVRGKKLLTAIRAMKAGAVEVECPQLKRDDERLGFVRAEFEAAGAAIAPDAARQLVEAFHEDLTELAAACQQLVADVPGTVTAQHIDLYFGGRVETTGFKIADAVAAGRERQALVLFRHATLQGVSMVPLMVALASRIRLMAAVAGATGSDQQLAGAVGAAPWQVRNARRDAAAWHERELARAVRAVAHTDAGVKGGVVDAEFAVESLIRQLANRRIAVGSYTPAARA
ncbi:DNA polymerase III subunit delta [Pseudoclavibacter soli]|uniref:DNA polymerase III subunit delta n=1 Tax=Pseudoclavibacter soli TaxID=452623 RepID=UPI000411A682|nr:DNA polymerase III subunit delta [Pseudoclavibacter soli]